MCCTRLCRHRLMRKRDPDWSFHAGNSKITSSTCLPCKPDTIPGDYVKAGTAIGEGGQCTTVRPGWCGDRG